MEYNWCIDVFQKYMYLLYARNIFEKTSKYTVAYFTIIVSVFLISFVACFYTMFTKVSLNSFVDLAYLIGSSEVRECQFFFVSHFRNVKHTSACAKSFCENVIFRIAMEP